MAQTRIVLRKKWWQKNYHIYDGQNQIVAYSEVPSLFSLSINIYSVDKQLLIQLRRDLLAGNKYQIFKGSRVIGRFRASWTGTKYYLELQDSKIYELRKSGWGKKIEITSSGKSLGLISSQSSMFNEVGAVAEGLDSLILSACVIAIAMIKRNSS